VGGGEDEAPGRPLDHEDVEGGLELLLGAGQGPVVVEPAVEGEVGDPLEDLLNDRLEDEGEEQASERISLLKSRRAEDGVDAELEL
jgi:hypothetical protein